MPRARRRPPGQQLLTGRRRASMGRLAARAQGQPWRDVSYLVIGALTVDERRSADRDLVEHYRQRLIATGPKGCPIATAPGDNSCAGPAMARRPGWATSTNGASVAASRWSSDSSRP